MTQFYKFSLSIGITFVSLVSVLEASDWNGSINNDMDIAANWTPAGVPQGLGSQATFTGIIGSLIVPDIWTIGSIDVLAASTLSFTEDAPFGQFIEMVDNGVFVSLDSSLSITLGNTQLVFSNASTASNVSGSAVSYTINSGTIQFGETSKAGNALFTNLTSTTVDFFDSSSADSATFTLSSNFIRFSDSSAAGTATINASGGAQVIFNNNASLDSATYNLDGAIFDVNGSDPSSLATISLINSSSLDVTNALSVDSITTDASSTINIGSQFSFGNAGNQTIAGVISGGGFIEKTGTGIVTLTNTNTYSGGTLVSQGTLSALIPSIPGNVSVAAGATLQLSEPVSDVFSGAISGAGSVIVRGGGVTRFTGGNTYTGGTTLLDNSTNLVGTTVTLTGDMLLNLGTELTFDQNFNGTFAGNISGGGDVVVQAGGEVTFTGANSYSGGTTIQTGSTLTGNFGSIQGDIALNNGTVHFTGPSATYFDVISGSGNVIIDTTGTFQLIAINTYEGSTILDSGTLSISSSDNIGSQNGNLIFDGGTLLTTASFSDSRDVAINAGGGTVDTSTNSLTLTGDISGSGAWQKIGSGTLSLLGGSTYTGTLTVDAGTLVGTTTSLTGNLVDNAQVIFDQSFNGDYSGSISGTGSIVKQGTGLVSFSGTNTYTGGTTISAGTLQGNTDSLPGNILNNAQLIFDQNADGTFAGDISGSGDVVKQGSALLIFTGTNTYTGLTTISAGILQGNTNNLPGDIVNNSQLTFNQTVNGTYDDDISGTGSLLKIGGGILELTGVNTYTGGTTISGGALQGDTDSLTGNIVDDTALIFNQLVNGTFAGDISGSGLVIKNGAGTLILTGTNTYTGSTNVNDGTLQGDTNSLQGQISNNSHVVFDQTFDGAYSGEMSGSGDVVKLGLGTLEFNTPGSNTYTGGTTIVAGTLVGNTNTLPGDILNNAQLIFNQNFDGTFAGVISGTGSVEKQGSALLILTGANTYAGFTAITSGTLQGDTNSLPGNIVDNAQLIFDQNFDASFNHTISGSGSVEKQGIGTLILTQPNTYTGGTIVTAGTLQGTTDTLVGDILDNSIVSFTQNFAGSYDGDLSGVGSVIIDGGGSVTYTGINSYTGGTNIMNASTLIGTTSNIIGTINLSGASTLTLDQSFDGIFNATLIGDSTNTFEKLGDGTVTINTDQSLFLGITNILDGKISLNAVIGGDVFVSGSGILGGVGTINGDLSVTGGGTVAPANSIGTLTVVGNYTQTDGTLEVHINGAGESSLLDVGGTATISGNATVFVTSDDGIYNTSVDYLFLNTGGGIIGDFAQVISANPIFTPEVTFNPARTQAFLSFGGDFLNIARTFNEQQVANQLNSITDPSDALAAVLDALAAAPTEVAQNALNQMTGQQYSNLLVRAELANRQFIRQLYNPVRELLIYDPCCTCCDSGLEIWAEGSIGRGLFAGSSEADSIRMTEYEISLGAHTTIQNTLLVGAAISYLRDNVFYTVGGTGEYNTILGGLYGLYRTRNYYVLGDFVIGHSNDHVRREIDIGTISFEPSTNVGIFQTGGYLEMGFDWNVPCLLVQPFAGLEIDYTQQDRLRERSDTPLDMTFESRSYTSAFGRIGAHLTPFIPFAGWFVSADAAFDWRFNSTTNHIHGFFNDFGTDFSIIGVDFDRYGVDGSIFISRTFACGWEIFIEGSGFVGDQTASYEGTLGLIFTW